MVTPLGFPNHIPQKGSYMRCMVSIICFLTCINNGLHCRTNLGFITPCQMDQVHGHVYMFVDMFITVMPFMPYSILFQSTALSLSFQG